MKVALIPARGGSKGLPNKNILDFCGKPLIAWSIQAALNAKLVDEVYVSTDSRTISSIAIEYGAKVLKRPDDLSNDIATTLSVVGHAASNILSAELFIVLQPTSPIRGSALVDDCISKFIKSNCTNLATGYWCKFKEFGTHSNLRRQDIKGFFYDDGSVYILPRKLIELNCWYGENIYRYENPKYMNFEIDDEIDLIMMKSIYEKYKISL